MTVKKPNEFILEKFDSGMHYIMLDPNQVSSLTANNNKRIICQLNEQVSFHAAIMTKKEAGHFITIGATICKKLNIKQGSKVTATFTSDTTKYQFEMPEELQEVLKTDPEANTMFHTLTKGNQRSLMYLVSQVKSTDKRIDRALKIAEKIKNGITSAKIILK